MLDPKAGYNPMNYSGYINPNMGRPGGNMFNSPGFTAPVAETPTVPSFTQQFQAPNNQMGVVRNSPYMAPQRRNSGYRFSDPRAARHMAATTTRPAYGVPGSYDLTLGALGYYQPQQTSPYPFQIPSLGDFYQPHGMGDAQNTSSGVPGANFLGNAYITRAAPPRPF